MTEPGPPAPVAGERPSAGAQSSSADPVAARGPADAEPPVLLPEPVRARVLELAAECLGALPVAEVPASLVRVARFTPGKRARLAAAPLSAALESDASFRDRVGEAVGELRPALVAALEAGTVPSAAPPAEVAAICYLVRPPGWVGVLRRCAEQLAAADLAARRGADTAELDRLRRQLTEAQAASRSVAEALGKELASARAQADNLRGQLREAKDGLRKAEAALSSALEAAAAERGRAATSVSEAESVSRRLRARLTDAESGLELARRAEREGRTVADIRLRVLLDSLLGAAQGLRRELALPPVSDRPADMAAEADRGGGGQGGAAGGEAGPRGGAGAEGAILSPLAGIAGRGLSADDPAFLEALLGAPGVHLVVDGYNVTKTGYASQPLQVQRARLVAGLAGLVARTRAEVTCVFDGAERPAGVAPAAPRGVRVIFSRVGETADEVIRRLARAEPAGRAVVVVSSDREVVEGVSRVGALPVPALGLARLLERG